MDPNVTPEVEIRASARRRKTGVAFWEAGHVVVVVPERMSRAARDSFVEQLVRQLLQRTGRRHASDAGLAARAAVLADQYLGGIRPSSIRWSTRQQRRWGSCSLHSREIRIASRLQTVPEWVLDGVIVHELTHLLEAGHTARFHELANSYRARSTRTPISTASATASRPPGSHSAPRRTTCPQRWTAMASPPAPGN